MDYEPQSSYMACAPLGGLVSSRRIGAVGKMMVATAAATLGVVGLVLWNEAPEEPVVPEQHGDKLGLVVTVHRVVGGVCQESLLLQNLAATSHFSPGSCKEAGYTYITGFQMENLTDGGAIQVSTFSTFGTSAEEQRLMADNTKLLAQLAKLKAENRKMAKLLPAVTMSSVKDGGCTEVKVPATTVSSALTIGPCAARGFPTLHGDTTLNVAGLGDVAAVTYSNRQGQEEQLKAENQALAEELAKVKEEDKKLSKMVEGSSVSLVTNQNSEEQKLMTENTKLFSQLLKLKIEDRELENKIHTRS